MFAEYVSTCGNLANAIAAYANAGHAWAMPLAFPAMMLAFVAPLALPLVTIAAALRLLERR